MLSMNDEIMTTSDESSTSFDQDDHQQCRTREEIERINALKNLQISYNRLESRYLKSVHELECQFSRQCSHLFERRAEIINGKYQPTDEQCRLQTDFIERNEREISSVDDQGIPSFWLHTLKQVPIIAEMIEEWDEPILKCLSDVKLSLQIEPIQGFTIEFHFNEQCREYFRNEILTKFYELQIEPADDDDALFYEGTAIVRSIGCTIDWIDTRTDVTRNEQTNEFQESFFHFFTTPSVGDDWKSAIDFQIGYYLREYLLPKAILYYTGEIFDDDDDDDDNDEQDISFYEQLGEGEH